MNSDVYYNHINGAITRHVFLPAIYMGVIKHPRGAIKTPTGELNPHTTYSTLNGVFIKHLIFNSEECTSSVLGNIKINEIFSALIIIS